MKKILLVDDQAHVLRVIKLSLDRNGYEVDTALNGELALQKMKAQRYDVLITDLTMPTMSGCQLCETVYRDHSPNLPLMFIVTDTMGPELEAWTGKYPEVEFLDKPMSLRWLVARLGELFGHYEKTGT